MQSTLIILISVLGWITAQSDTNDFCAKTKHDLFFEPNEETVVIYDKNGDVCVTARFSMIVIVNEDGFVEENRKRRLELHEQTDNHTGICAGETALLGRENVTGPAVLFRWNETNSINQVLIHWEVTKEETFLSEIKIYLNLTDPSPQSQRKNRYLYGELENQHLFPTEVGQAVSVDAREFSVLFRDSSKGCLKFRTADYTISGTYSGLSVVTVVVLALILGVLMALGLLFYQRGSQKKLASGQPYQT